MHNNSDGDRMKKLLIIISLMFFPMNVLAYSEYIYRGGNTIGIEVECDGILIVGFYEINGHNNSGDLKVGDYIVKVNDKEVNTLKDLTNEIESSASNLEVKITYRRKDEEKDTILKLVKDDGIYKTGLYVKDNITGIGTLTYIDPKSNIFGALGHEIIESNSNRIVEIKDGTIFKNTITSIDKSSVGHAGSKNAKYYYNKKYGEVMENTNHGIFGTTTNEIKDMKLVKVGNAEDIKIGEAYIYTVLDGENVEEFTIDITSINENSDTKNILFTITDKKLLEKAGGVVQGMSGSPIMQNDKIIGVVTHVIVDNPVTGYGLFITKMLEEGEN